MGGVKDGQPPLKRLRLSFSGSNSLSRDLIAEEPIDSTSLGDLMARPIQCQGEEEVIGSRGVIRRNEFVRLIAGSLYALGYQRTGACLEEESNIPLQSTTVNLFMQHVLDGKWDESVSTLHKIGLEDETIIKSAKFLILEQKFFELLNDGKTMDALMTLRMEISTLHIKTNRVHELSSCLLSQSESQNGHMDSLRTKPRSELLEELQQLLPPSIMVPARRLEQLVEQALTLQRGTCIFHNSSDQEMSLYADHHCGKNNIPSHTSQILEEHQDEVWFLQFSHKGKYLASASNDRSAIIWEVVNGEVILKQRLYGHQKSVAQVSWSPDDQQLLTCGTEETVRRWDVLSGECLQVYEKAGFPVVSCAWSPDGKTVFGGLSDKSICMWDLNGKEVECWKGHRTLKISDLEITRDGKQIISMCREKSILIYNKETNVEHFIEEDHPITSFCLSNDSKFLLVSVINQEIHLWTIDGDAKLVAKYKGHKRSRFLIRSCFGGLEQSFIASGSEDSQVYIWHRGSGQLVDVLPGHSGAVNCVSWNPADPHMLASASDDRTIRIWGLNGVNIRPRVTQSNGNHHCNGNGTI
ncbi:WD repeat-containing protein 26 homolog [Silene latifolia]|uniref:WD repeat-containing protein 26 homolog n=1 Tax=Silene latifolia TaxID=37657 RepID=UPI003D78B2A7